MIWSFIAVIAVKKMSQWYFNYNRLMHKYTGLFKTFVGVQLCSGNSAPNLGNNHHLTIPFEGGMHSFKRQGACVSRHWWYESELPLKPSPLTRYKQFGTNSIIAPMFVQSQRVHIYTAPVRYVTKTWRIVILNKEIHVLLSHVYCVWQVVKTPTIIWNNSVYHNIFSLCNVRSYTFWHLCVILRELQNLCLAKLCKFLKLMLFKLKFHKIIGLKYIKILFCCCWVLQ
jgi:hypothetical protein